MALTYEGKKGSRNRKVSNEYTEMLDGFAELQSELAEIVQGCDEKHREKALYAASCIITDEARRRAPVDTGYLSDRGIVSVVLNGNEADIGWTSDAFYGRFLEMGTSKMVARPHLRPAYEAKKNQVVEVMRKELNLD